MLQSAMQYDIKSDIHIHGGRVYVFARPIKSDAFVFIGSGVS